ncbi:hypothetical protein FGG08_004626 [Glutinoglossum americanum]|uniref:Uncharacterized protein n=1 Tax=Glutinoglossum americanum TaxID=1670608 RepID=A0A9P8I8T8_9PEZI|nr:hypothetical protein FGG08_004626 [Glutinoglossum americanum]
MSLSPETYPTSYPNPRARDNPNVRQSGSAAATRKIIDDSLKVDPSDYSLTSARPSPTPSLRNLDLFNGGGPQNSYPTNYDGGGRRGSEGTMSSYKQALADAGRGGEEFLPRLSDRKQSWSEQDMKRVMHERSLGAEVKKMQGFSSESASTYGDGAGGEKTIRGPSAERGVVA